MSQQTLFVVPPAFSPEQAKRRILEWLQSEPNAPLDIDTATFDNPEVVLVPVTFISATATADFSATGSYEEHDAGIINKGDDEPTERYRTPALANGKAQGYINGLPISRVKELPAAPLTFEKARAAEPDELTLLRLQANFVDNAWNAHIRQVVEDHLRASAREDADKQIRRNAPRGAKNFSVDEVQLSNVHFSMNEAIDAWAAFYHVRYSYQIHRVHVLLDGQNYAVYGQRIVSTMRQWQAMERARKRRLLNLILVTLFLVPIGILAYLFISNAPEADNLVLGIVVVLFALTYVGLFKTILDTMRPHPKPDKDQAVLKGDDIRKLL